MLIADGGGGYGGTNWSSHDVWSMWAALSGQETDSHWDVVTGWRQTTELTSTHLSRVTAYRDQLAAAWPPEKSQASAAYLARLDELIGHLRETNDAASANYTTFSTLTGTLDVARAKVKKIYDEFIMNQGQINAWKADQAAATQAAQQASSSSTPTASPSPRPSPVPSSPPVPLARQEQLTNEARAIMFDLSSTVVSSRAALQQPTPYVPVAINKNGDKDTATGGSGVALPPPIPMPGSGDVSSSPARPHTPVSVQPPTYVASPTPPPTVGGPGPGLAGIHQHPVAPPATAPGNIGITPTAPPTSGGGVGLLTPPTGSVKPMPSGSNPLMPTNGKSPSTGTVKPGTSPTSVRQPNGVPQGRVIGQVPGGLSAQSRLPASAPRVNPVGGVIGGTPVTGGPGRPGAGAQGGAGRPGAGGLTAPGRPGLGHTGTPGALGTPGMHGVTRPVGGAQGTAGGQGRPSASRFGMVDGSGRPLGGSPGMAGPAVPMTGQPGRGRRDEERGQQQWDPDNPWTTNEGVDPVLLPTKDSGPIDPGPVIGYNR